MLFPLLLPMPMPFSSPPPFSRCFSMDEELKCPHCRLFLCQPVLLPCGHSYCRKCALQLQRRCHPPPCPPLPPLPFAPCPSSASPLPPACPSSSASPHPPPLPHSSSSIAIPSFPSHPSSFSAPSSSGRAAVHQHQLSDFASPFSGASDTLSLAPSCDESAADSATSNNNEDSRSLLSDSADSGVGGTFRGGNGKIFFCKAKRSDKIRLYQTFHQ